MSRSRLPDRREGLVINVTHPGTEFHQRPTTYDVTIGFPDGIGANQPREVFIGCNKLTTAMHVAGLEVATLISIALQHGATIAELAAAMPRDDANKPQGAAGAVLDAVLAEIGGGR
jgi:hypothetical protein